MCYWHDLGSRTGGFWEGPLDSRSIIAYYPNYLPNQLQITLFLHPALAYDLQKCNWCIKAVNSVLNCDHKPGTTAQRFSVAGALSYVHWSPQVKEGDTAMTSSHGSLWTTSCVVLYSNINDSLGIIYPVNYCQGHVNLCLFMSSRREVCGTGQYLHMTACILVSSVLHTCNGNGQYLHLYLTRIIPTTDGLMKVLFTWITVSSIISHSHINLSVIVTS